MRTLAIGDIHGCLRSFESLADIVGFQPDDVIVTLGDYVDRGPDSKGVLDYLIKLGDRHQLVPLRGNHEIMMLEAKRNRIDTLPWIQVGGGATIDSYEASSMNDIPSSHWRFLEETRPFHETEQHFFVHANAYPDLPLQNQPDYMLYWETFGSPAKHESGKTMVCGHTSQRSGQVLDVGHAICIDTYAHGGGWLTCLEVNTGLYWQANEAGETRLGQRQHC